MKKLNISIALLLCILISSISIANAQGYGMQNRMKSFPGLGAADANYDMRFLDMMVKHRQHEILMAQDALSKARHPELKKFAQDVINNNPKQIEQMQTWRKMWYGK
ncbi:MAG: DUF305 domain-containing protein [Candidatus Gastranaerophilales bacterium]|nr:DUF305 domain-containing protein [Candidatus Gastranaerophilales bacterium]